jgi:hypothetical protein
LRHTGKWGRERAFLTSRERVPALEPLLANQSFARLVNEYLGGPARFDGYATFQLSPNATVEDYISGQWHHDRCGRRLRLFVFTHDVVAAEMPTTQAARGSQNTVYFSHADRIGLTRFSDPYVRSRYNVVTLDGPAGGGFLLDTNAIHRGQLGGSRPRTAVMMEFHRHGKIPRLATEQSTVTALPCPSIKQGENWTAGMPGFELFPPEQAAPFRRQRQRSVVMGRGKGGKLIQMFSRQGRRLRGALG